MIYGLLFFEERRTRLRRVSYPEMAPLCRCRPTGRQAWIAALERCAFYLGNDTGTMHMAVAAGIPCVAVFSSRDFPGNWYPYGNGHVVFRTPIKCEGCFLEKCIENEMRCTVHQHRKSIKGCRGNSCHPVVKTWEMLGSTACGGSESWMSGTELLVSRFRYKTTKPWGRRLHACFRIVLYAWAGRRLRENSYLAFVDRIILELKCRDPRARFATTVIQNFPRNEVCCKPIEEQSKWPEKRTL